MCTLLDGLFVGHLLTVNNSSWLLVHTPPAKTRCVSEAGVRMGGSRSMSAEHDPPTMYVALVCSGVR